MPVLLKTAPETLDLWYKQLPLKKIDTPWREHMIHIVDRPEDAEPFLSFSDGPNVHELAHLIACRDSDVLDPFWGIRFDSRFEESFATEVNFNAEVEVITIQSVLIYTYEDNSWWLYEGRDHKSVFRKLCKEFTRGSIIPRREDRKPWFDYNRFINRIDACLRRWPDADTVYAEFQRKVNLIDATIVAM